jgi:RNA polymerase sigma-70 factor (ECF subfamily)
MSSRSMQDPRRRYSRAVDPDLALLERWRDGDQQAGQDLFARHFAGIHRFFEHKVGGDADDLAQRTFLACVRARDQFGGRSSFRTYLFAIARNELYMYLRAKPRQEHVDFEVTSIAEIVTTLGSRLGRARQVERLRGALATLPAEQQLLLELCYWHELDGPALAEIFETTPGNIRIRLTRARAALRGRMGEVPAIAGDRLAASLSEPEVE